MLIEFRSTSGARVTLFGSVAKRLLALMGAGEKTPGTLQSDEVAAARRNLESSLAFQRALAGPDNDAGTLARQATRLIELLKEADKSEDDVHWVAP